LQYPQWLLQLFNEIGIPLGVLPKVVEPGQPVGPVSREARDKYGFSEQTMVVGGTTDSNASFMAAVVGSSDSSGSSDGSGGIVQHGGSLLDHYGIAVTSLGSTLAIKMLSRTFVEDCERGVYSHRFPSMGNGVPQVAKDHHERNDKGNDKGNDTSPLWLVGGASNVGCAVLRQEKFSNQELMELSNDMNVMTDSEFSYYPLTKQGERFPIADGSKEPILEPKPKSRQEYLKAILQGISKVERMGYDTLGNLGANPPFPTVIMTTGGGSKNEKWLQMRQRLLMQPCQDSSRTSSSRSSDSTTETVVGEPSFVKVLKAENTEASFGAAILASSFTGCFFDDF
jgi:xylulokinase